MSDLASTTGATPSVHRRADLHTHSTASDGTDAPADLLCQASRRGLSILALTDHDTTLGLPAAAGAADALGILFVSGIELSTDVARGEIHILGYGIDPESAELQRMLDNLRQSRETRAGRILDKLRGLGIDLANERIRPAEPGASIGRPHIAKALIEDGYATSVSDAFERFLGQGKPTYVPSERLSPSDAVRLICSAGGLPVLAHPFSSPDFPHTLRELIAVGLGGLEVYYGEYDNDRRRVLADIAAQHALVATGGSDYHGEGFKERRDLGSIELPEDALQQFLNTVGLT